MNYWSKFHVSFTAPLSLRGALLSGTTKQSRIPVILPVRQSLGVGGSKAKDLASIAIPTPMSFPRRRESIQKLTAVLLTFLFILGPLSPAFIGVASAQEAPEPPAQSEPESSSVEQVSSPEAVAETVGDEAPVTPVTPTDDDEGTLVNYNSPKNTLKFPEADQSTGALVYRYPLTLPPGRNGLAPEFALAYNNQNTADGSIVGYGWSLDIPYIERLNKHGSNELYTRNDFTSSLTGELIDLGSGSFGSRVEGGEFLNYALSGNTWAVKDKRGTLYKFGMTAGSRQDDPADVNKVYKWMLEEVRDTNDNFIRYEYFKDQGQIYPSRIVYTGSGSTDGPFSVVLTREVRTDLYTSYASTFAMTTSYRISLLQVYQSGLLMREYQLSYTTGSNNYRSLLASIAETGYSESEVPISLPPVQFQYSLNTPSWPLNTTWYYSGTNSYRRFGGANGDAFPDIFYNYDSNGTLPPGASNVERNNTQTSWSPTGLPPAPPIPLQKAAVCPWTQSYYDQGVISEDINGDFLVDFVQHLQYEGSGGGQQLHLTDAYLNVDGESWVQSTQWSPDLVLYMRCSIGNSSISADFNGDGLPDIHKSEDSGAVYGLQLNTGSGFAPVTTDWTPPLDVTVDGSRFVDVNKDGLADNVHAHWYSENIKRTYINHGTGQWTELAQWQMPAFFIQNGFVLNIQFIDINADGLLDIYWISPLASTPSVYLNTGNSWEQRNDWRPDNSGTLLQPNTYVMDVNADGLVDFINIGTGGSYFQNEGEVSDLLENVIYPQGGSSEIIYKASTQYRDPNSSSVYNIVNPNLPFIVHTVEGITNNDGLGASSTATYFYEGGEYYYAGPFDRKFAGFHKITKTDSVGNKAITFYHQGSETNSAQGEFSDHFSKIGRPYRVEQRDASDNLYATTINKWENVDLGSDRHFVKLSQSLEQAFDGNGTHKDKATSSTYNNANGNVTQSIAWGEVTGSDDGTFTDIGSDKFVTDYTYATGGTYGVTGLPATEIVNDQSASKVREARHYYDVLGLGSVDKGNETKTEHWVTGTTYVDTEKTYNSFGLVTQELDARNKPMNYVYDTYNLYPATVTNALNQATQLFYDYSLGKPDQVIDANGFVYQTVYDGLDRVAEEKQPDLVTPTTLVTKTAYVYTDTPLNVNVKRTDYLDATTSVDAYTYLDGLGRAIQTRQEAETSGQFAVTDTVYNDQGLVLKESLPYFASGSARTAPSAVEGLYTTYTYDTLQRPTQIVNAVGTTMNAYDDWKLTVTDARNKPKSLYRDAHGQLIKVEEFDATNTYTTLYTYNGLGNLVNITDAAGNVRNFTYDGLGRRLTAQDLHAPADVTFGTWVYTYDAAGNLLTKLDPKSQNIAYTHDDLSRPLTEDYTGQTGTEVTYTYDTCLNGVGKQCASTSAALTESRQYNALGAIAQETKTISSQPFVTSYTSDRAGNQLEITNPDGSQVKYVYNSAGLLNQVQRKESVDPSFVDVVTNFDYSPLGKVTLQENANGSVTTNTYDASKLYRLISKLTTTPGSAGSPVTATFYPEAGDGYVTNTNASWDTAHDGSVGISASPTSTTQNVKAGFSAGNYRIDRAFLPFDTSSLPDDATITDVKLKVYVDSKVNGDNDGDDWVSVVQTSQAGTSTLVTDDYDQAGAINNPVEGIDVSERKDITNVTTGQYLEFTLNSIGRGWVAATGYTKLGLREGHDAIDSVYVVGSASSNNLALRTSEYTGTSSDPILEVTYTPAPTGSAIIQDLTYVYDANGNITQIVDASETNSAKTVDYTYDDLNRLLTAVTTAAANGQNYSQTFAYDGLGNILSGPAGAYAYTGNQGSSYANPHAVTDVAGTAYTYDNNGNVVGQGATAHTWDYNNRLAQTDIPGQGGDPITVSFYPSSGDGYVTNTGTSWDTIHDAAAGNSVSLGNTQKVKVGLSGSSYRIDRAFLPFDTSSLPDDATITQVKLKLYVESKVNGDNDGDDWVSVVQTSQASTSTLTTDDYDQAGATNNPVEGIDVSERKDITNVTTGQYLELTLNSTGRGWVSKSGYTKLGMREGHDAIDSAYVVGTASANDLTIRTSEYTGTSSDPILEVTYTQGPPPATTTYEYDPSGQRVKVVSGATSTLYPERTYNTDGTTAVKHIFAGDMMVATVKGTGAGAAVFTVATDHLTGSNVATNSAGAQEELTDYFPFGAIRLDEQAGTFNEQRKFAGHEYDTATGLTYMNARYYDGAVGRFFSQDPAYLLMGDRERFKQRYDRELERHLADPQALNSYSYVNNNPLKHVDTSGELIDIVLDAAFIGYDIYRIGQVIYRGEGLSALGHEAANLGLDTIGAFVPFATGLGLANRAAKTARAVDAKALPAAVEALKVAPEVIQAQRHKLLSLAQHPEAQKIINEVFRARDEFLGGTAGALKIEKLFGIKLSQYGHEVKAMQRIKNITNTLSEFGSQLDNGSVKVLNDIKQGLERALRLP